MVELGFRGEVSELYRRYRSGYPPSVFTILGRAFGLGPDDVAVDMGCGTGQLAVPLAAEVGIVVGMDPEPDMLAQARGAAAEASVENALWVLGRDTDLPWVASTLAAGTPGRGLGALTIGHALQWMDHERLFAAARTVLRPAGGLAVVTNGVPLWLQDTGWSRALRGCMEEWFGGELTLTCGTDEASQEAYRASAVAAGYDVRLETVEYVHELTLDQVLGGLYSAFSVDHLPPPEQRSELGERIRAALEPHAPFSEHVVVRLLLGHPRDDVALP